MRQFMLGVACVFSMAICAVSSSRAVAQQAPREKRPTSAAAAPPGMFREVTFTSGPVATVGVVGLMPAGSKLDLAWAGPKLWWMRQPPDLEPVPIDTLGWFGQLPPGAGLPRAYLTFDGEYVWAPLWRHRKEPKLFVLKPGAAQQSGADAGDAAASTGAGAVDEFTSQDGLRFLPLDQLPDWTDGQQYLALAPLRPGEVCAVGTAAATWLARLTYGPDQRKKVDRIHEAAKVYDGSPNSDRARTDWAFHPRFMFTLSADGGASEAVARRVIVGRTTPHGPLPPLVVDPANKSVAALADPAFSHLDERAAVHAGQLYWLQPAGEAGQWKLTRAAVPKLAPEVMADGVHDGQLISDGDRLHVVGESWSAYTPAEAKLRTIASATPWVFERPFNAVAGDQANGHTRRFSLLDVSHTRQMGLVATARQWQGPSASIVMSDDAGQARTAASEPDGKEKPDTPDAVRRAWARGASAAIVRVYLGDTLSGVRSTRPWIVAEAPTEPDQLNADDRLPLLARELVRQAVLMAARDELGWITRDELLGETHPDSQHGPTATVVLGTGFSSEQPAAFDLVAVISAKGGETLWNQTLEFFGPDAAPANYITLAATAEGWSRQVYPKLLVNGQLTKSEVPAPSDAELAVQATGWLNEMNYFSQLSALREAHKTIRERGESPALLGALVRGYANVALLTEFHWTAVHKTFKARALLYAERFVARHPRSSAGLRHRAYARAFVGLPDAALDDLAAAAKMAGEEPASEVPAWVPLIDAYCRFQPERLVQFTDDELAPLARLLECLATAALPNSSAAISVGEQALDANPDCFYLYDRLCDSQALSVLHMATRAAPAALDRSFISHLRRSVDRPPAAMKLLDQSRSKQQVDRQDGKQVRGAPIRLNELADALIETSRSARDSAEISWSLIGQATHEIRFAQFWRLAHFMKFQWAVPVDGLVAAALPMLENHRYRTFIALHSSADESLSAEFMGRLAMAELDQRQYFAMTELVREAWHAARPRQLTAAAERYMLHRDDIYRDLLEMVHWTRGPGEEQRLEKLRRNCPHGSAWVTETIRSFPAKCIEQGAEWERRYADKADLLWTLAEAYRHEKKPNDAVRVLRAYVRLSPDRWAYQQLAQNLLTQGDEAGWQATLDEFLKTPEHGLDHAQMRVEIANHIMDKGEWERALPYAEAAAESWAEWAMMCVVRCYQGLRDDENEGLWRERLAERYPGVVHLRNLYFWVRRTGQPPRPELVAEIDRRMPNPAADATAVAQYRIGSFFLMSDRPRKALAAFERGAARQDDPGTSAGCAIMHAVTAWQIGLTKERDAILEKLNQRQDESSADLRAVSGWLRALPAPDAKRQPDVAKATKLIESSEATHRPLITYAIARGLDLAGHHDAAIPLLQLVATHPSGTFSASRELACAELRDRGLVPGEADGKAAKPADE